MTRAALVAALCAQLSCAMATKHPAITAAVTGGGMGLFVCGMDELSAKDCGYAAGGAALLLGGIAAIMTTFFDTSAHQLPLDDEEIVGPGMVRVRTRTPLPPMTEPPPGAALPPPVAPPDAAPAPVQDAPVPVPAPDAQ
jgi:hypothetical protein